MLEPDARFDPWANARDIVGVQGTGMMKRRGHDEHDHDAARKQLHGDRGDERIGEWPPLVLDHSLRPGRRTQGQGNRRRSRPAKPPVIDLDRLETRLSTAPCPGKAAGSRAGRRTDWTPGRPLRSPQERRGNRSPVSGDDPVSWGPFREGSGPEGPNGMRAFRSDRRRNGRRRSRGRHGRKARRAGESRPPASNGASGGEFRRKRTRQMSGTDIAGGASPSNWNGIRGGRRTRSHVSKSQGGRRREPWACANDSAT